MGSPIVERRRGPRAARRSYRRSVVIVQAAVRPALKALAAPADFFGPSTATTASPELSRRAPTRASRCTSNGSAPISDKFIPVADFKNLADINFKLEIDGQLKQQGNTSLMLFPFDYIIAYLSKFFTLKTGDLIFTGTPKGVGPVVIGNKLSAYIENEKLLEFEVK